MTEIIVAAPKGPGEYRAELEALLERFRREARLLPDTVKRLNRKVSEEELLVSQFVLDEFARGAALLETDWLEGAAVLADLPYRMAEPSARVRREGHRCVGSTAAYLLLGDLRHALRMLHLAGGGPVGGGEGEAERRLWNNVDVF